MNSFFKSFVFLDIKYDKSDTKFSIKELALISINHEFMEEIEGNSDATFRVIDKLALTTKSKRKVS